MQVPVLETAHGSIFESNAIARYIGRLRRDTELYGVSFFETAQVRLPVASKVPPVAFFALCCL